MPLILSRLVPDLIIELIALYWIVAFLIDDMMRLPGFVAIRNTNPIAKIIFTLIAEYYLLNFSRFVFYLAWEKQFPLSINLEDSLLKYIGFLLVLLAIKWVYTLGKLLLRKPSYSTKTKLLISLELFLLPLLAFSNLFSYSAYGLLLETL